MLEEHLKSVADLAAFLKKRPNHQQIASWISAKAIKNSGVFYYEMDSDGWIRVRAMAGFDEINLTSLPAKHLNDESEVSELFRRMKIISYSESQLKKKRLENSKKSGEDTFRKSKFYKWKSAVGIPIGSDKAYSILFQIDITLVDGFSSGLEILHAMLETYEEFSEEGLNMQPRLVPTLKGTPLTSRQRVIVKMIEEGKTNSQIALSIGYSESLIRQETIIIYKKLGISGRKELNLDSPVANIQ